MIFSIAALLILVLIFTGVAVPLAFLGGSFFVAYIKFDLHACKSAFCGRRLFD